MSTQSERIAEQIQRDMMERSAWSSYRGPRWTWIRPGLQATTNADGDLWWTHNLDVALHLAEVNAAVVVDAEQYIKFGILVDRHVFPTGCSSRVRWEITRPKPAWWKKALYDMTRKGWYWINGRVWR